MSDNAESDTEDTYTIPPEQRLTNAILSDKYEEVYELIEKYNYLVDSNINIYEMKPIHLALNEGSFKIFKYIVDKTPNVDLAYSSNITAVYSAASCGSLKKLMYLDTYKNANLECKLTSGHQPIHIASQLGHFEIVKYLSERNVDLECQDNYGRTPLHYAVRESHLNIVQHLVSRNVSLNCQDNNGQTPLHMVKMSQSGLDVAKYLMQQNVDTNVKDKDGNVAFDKIFLTSPSNSGWFHCVLTLFETQFFKKHLSSTQRSEIAQLMDKRLGESTICRFKNNDQVHFVERPIQFECGHVACIDCVMEKVAQNCHRLFFCCLKNVLLVNNDTIMNYRSYDMKKLDGISFNTVAGSLFNLLRSSIGVKDNMKNKIESYESHLSYFEDELEIRCHSIKEELHSLQKRIKKRMDNIKSTCKTYFKLQQNEASIDSIKCFESLHFGVSRKKIYKKEIGFITHSNSNFQFTEKNNLAIIDEASEDEKKTIEMILNINDLKKIAGTNEFVQISDEMIYYKEKRRFQSTDLAVLWNKVIGLKGKGDKSKSEIFAKKIIFQEIEKLIGYVKSNEDLQDLRTALSYVNQKLQEKITDRKRISLQQLVELRKKTDSQLKVEEYLIEVKSNLCEICGGQSDTVNIIIENLFGIYQSLFEWISKM